VTPPSGFLLTQLAHKYPPPPYTPPGGTYDPTMDIPYCTDSSTLYCTVCGHVLRTYSTQYISTSLNLKLQEKEESMRKYRSSRSRGEGDMQERVGVTPPLRYLTVNHRHLPLTTTLDTGYRSVVLETSSVPVGVSQRACGHV
jgi:hypothetical protein